MFTTENTSDLENGLELLSWIVLDSYGDNLLLLSEYIIEAKEFYWWSYYWEDSDIREWLNDDFLNKSFSDDEKSMIQKMITSDKTEDIVFLLSAEEARGFFSSDSSQ